MLELKKFLAAKYAAIVFLSILILVNVNLQEWWPGLLKNWSNSKILYQDIPFYTGPLYPVFLKITSYCFSDTVSPKIFGLLVVFGYVSAAIAMFEIYLIRANVKLNKNLLSAYLVSIIAFFLIVSRFYTVYLSPDDYHTLSLFLYASIIIKLSIRDGKIKLDKHKYYFILLFNKIPISIIIGFIILNRFHEGLIFLPLYFLYNLFLLIYYKNLSFKTLIKPVVEIIISIFFALSFILLIGPKIGIANVHDVLSYLLIEAPKSKSFGHGNYFLKLLFNFSGEFKVIINSNINKFILLIILISFFISRILKLNILKKYNNYFYLLLTIISIIYGMTSALSGDNRIGTFIIIYLTLILILLQLLSIIYIIIKNKIFYNFDFTFIVTSSLLFSHILSTSGIINESLCILFLPGLIYNFNLIYKNILDNSKVKIFALIIFTVCSSYIVTSKIVSPKSWWLVSEPAIFDNRVFMFGSQFEAKYQNLEPSLAYADESLLIQSNALCSFISDTSDADTIFTYPVPYYSYSCKASKELKPYAFDFSYWYDVASLKSMDSIQKSLIIDSTSPKWVINISNPLALFESAKYYNSSTFINDYYHLKFINFLNNFLDNRYNLQYRYYLVKGRPVLDESITKILDGFYSQG